MRSAFQKRLTAALARAGVTLDGPEEWDPQVRDHRLFDRLSRAGMVGLGDAYVDGWWECRAIDQLFDRALRADVPAEFRMLPAVFVNQARERLLNLQTRRRAGWNGRAHYNLGNDLFEAMLDRRLTYSCAFWGEGDDLHAAQERKLELVCRKLGLGPGMRVLDVGCGWGSFVGYAAERHGCSCVGITISEEQASYATARYARLPVEVRVQDYRDVSERFDRVVSIGMFEHVGPKNYAAYFRAVKRSLREDGLALIHFFATQRPWPNRVDSEVLWITRRIFPGIVVPTLGQVGRAIDSKFVLEDLHNFGRHYDPTLLAWVSNFKANWETIRANYDERFYRMWRYYLLSCAGAFRSRKYQVWQLVLSPRGVPGGYERVRAGEGRAGSQIESLDVRPGVVETGAGRAGA